jgi:hypothetical protein
VRVLRAFGLGQIRGPAPAEGAVSVIRRGKGCRAHIEAGKTLFANNKRFFHDRLSVQSLFHWYSTPGTESSGERAPLKALSKSMATKRMLLDKSTAINASSMQAQEEAPVPRLGASLKVVPLQRAEPCVVNGAGQDGDAWLRLPTGVVVGLLLAIPFWVALMVWVLW